MEPRLLGSILGYPTNSNFFTGLQLNLTCFITFSYTILYDQIQHVNVRAMWTRSGSALDNNIDRNVVELYEVGTQQYQTSLLFNSLDKARDEGLYTCNIEAVFQQRNSTLVKKIQLSHNIEVQSKYKVSTKTLVKDKSYSICRSY